LSNNIENELAESAKKMWFELEDKISSNERKKRF